MDCGTTYVRHRSFYKVGLRVLGKQRVLGNRVTERQAALLYDSALFWLWGYCGRPDVRKFNLFKPGMAAPPLLSEVKELRAKLFRESGTECLDYYTNHRSLLMNKPTDTQSTEFNNFVFVEPEPTAEDLKDNGFTKREQWFAARHVMFGTYEEQKQRAFHDAKEDARLAEIQRQQGSEGERRLAEVERTAHEHQLAKRNAKRYREKEKFQAEVRRKANGLLPYIQGAQKWAKKPVIPVNASANEMAEYVRALRLFEKTAGNLEEKAGNLCNALGVLASEMAAWHQDMKSKEIMAPLAEAVAQLKAAIPTDAQGPEMDRLRARVEKFAWDAQDNGYELFQIAPFILRVRPGQPVPYNYRYVPENSDFCECWENLSRKE